MRDKVVSVADAVAVVRNGDCVATSGFVGIGTPDALLAALEARFLETKSPQGIRLLFAAGQGDGKDRGLNRLAHEGLVARAVGGHWGLVPKLGRLAVDNKIEAWNLPQGCISHLYRDTAAGKPGTLSKVGLRTFVDPRVEGGRINSASTEDMVRLVEIGGEEWLFYKAQPIDVAFLRGTTADPNGNVSMEREALTLDNLAMAMATRNSGGIVIVQVERIAESGSLPARQVKLPGVLVDCVVVAEPAHHMQTYATAYSPSFAAEIRVPLDRLTPMTQGPRRIIARRAAFELPMNGVVNLGIGMPEGVAAVANEERLLDRITLTAEPGVVGGVPASGLDFGAAVNTQAVIDQNQQFDFYDGGGLDLACLGMAEVDGTGNVNVSRFGPKLAGAGGFINISQNARKLVFAGTFTASGLDIVVKNGAVSIRREGTARKFLQQVQQITFSGPYAAHGGNPVLYVTERCVFRLTSEGLELTEIAPGIDIERDILAQMAFHPIVKAPAVMDPRIFADGPMGLRDTLIDLPLEDRIGFDPARDILFLNFEGLEVRTLAQVKAIRDAVSRRCEEIGRRVGVVVNYDGFFLGDDLGDAYAAMVADLERRHYTTVSRYTTSAFMRLKLGGVLQRAVKPQIFETRDEAHQFLSQVGWQRRNKP